MMSEVVVLTGAAGCLGHHTLKLLISGDERVREIRCLDVAEPNSLMKQVVEEELQKVNSESKVTAKTVTWFKGDIRDVNLVEQCLRQANCVIHCAAKVDFWTEPSEQDKDELESINLEGTENLLRVAVSLGVPKFIHVSSFEVYTTWDTLYYCTEATLPETTWLLFGPSAESKRKAELKVKEYSNTKLAQSAAGSTNADSLNAIIVRFPQIYGEFDKHFVSKILEATKFFGGKLRRLSNVWIRQQPIYAGNAAWSLIKAKQRMDKDQSISGEEFHITDETTIGDPFDFIEPFVECKGMCVTKKSYPSFPIWLLLLLVFAIKRYLVALDFLNLFTNKRGRLQEAIEKDKRNESGRGDLDAIQTKKRAWYHYVTPPIITFMTISSFLNRTKASLRLDYDPVFDPIEAKERSLDWYKNHLKI